MIRVIINNPDGYRKLVGQHTSRVVALAQAATLVLAGNHVIVRDGERDTVL